MSIKNIALAFTAALLPALTLAAQPDDVQIVGSKSPAPSVVVHVGDLDAATPAGAQVLHERLSSAAWQVCTAVIPNPVSIEGGKCRTQLVNAALADVSRKQAALR